jgi:hypothetical protein
MMTIWIAGSLNYHNETVVEPILAELKKRNINHVWIKPKREDGANVHVEEMTVVTLEYWEEMLKQITGSVMEGDSVLILDFWNPIIFQLKFYDSRFKMGLKFFTIHHGSSHLSGDFAAQPGYKEWVWSFEDSWIRCYNKIFFGSKNAKSAVWQHRLWIFKVWCHIFQ